MGIKTIVIDAGCKNPRPLFEIAFPKPAISLEGDTKKPKYQKMKTLIIKLLGLNTLVEEINLLKNEVLVLTDEVTELAKFKKDLATAQDGLSAKVDEVTEKIDELEIPDMDDYVQSSDLDDNIESYLNNNDYATTSYVDDEIQSKVDEAIEDADIDSKIESAIEDLDIEEKVRDLFNDASPAPMSEDAIKEEVSESVRKALAEVLSKAYDQVQKS